MTTTADLRAIADSRSTLYKLLSRLYLEEVDAETLKALCALQLENAPEAIAEPAARLRARCEAMTDETLEADLEALAVDYARIFLGAGVAEGDAAIPYESVYTSPQRLLMQNAWESVRHAYLERGIAVKPRIGLYEDHLGIELGFMASLAARDGSTESLQASATSGTLLEGLCFEEAFLRDHLLRWVPRLAADVRRITGTTGFYQDAADLTEAWLALDAETLRDLKDELQSDEAEEDEVHEEASDKTTASDD